MSKPSSRSPLFLAIALLFSIGALFVLIRQKPHAETLPAAAGKLSPKRLAQVDALLRRGETHAALIRIEAAREDAHPEFLASRIRCLVDTGRLDEAAACLDQEKARPNHPALVHARIQLQLGRRDFPGLERSAALLRLTQPSDCRTMAVEALRACLKGDSLATMRILDLLRQVAGPELHLVLPPSFLQAFRSIPSFPSWERAHLAAAAP
ncbi:MAG: hypothetical protein RL095_3591 [Verrucomicrobiota bacterium]|jgi:hypothetical protein